MTEYQPRTTERLLEILGSESTGPRSWQAEAAAEINRLSLALVAAKPLYSRRMIEADNDKMAAALMAIVKLDGSKDLPDAWKIASDTISALKRAR